MTKLFVKDICKSFSGIQVLEHFSLELESGEILALMGPSGAGKTTLLRCMTNLESIDEGTIGIDEDYLFKDAQKINNSYYQKRIGLVFQSYHLFPNKSVLQNCTLALRGDKKAKDKVMECLKKLRINDKADQYPSKLSGGQKQRVAIARAIVLHPDFICFDEPTSALDRESIEDVKVIIQDLAKDGMGVLVVTHDEIFAHDIATRIIKI